MSRGSILEEEKDERIAIISRQDGRIRSGRVLQSRRNPCKGPTAGRNRGHWRN